MEHVGGGASPESGNSAGGVWPVSGSKDEIDGSVSFPGYANNSPGKTLWSFRSLVPFLPPVP